jgi:DNA-binding MarR family transcriptional regulator
MTSVLSKPLAAVVIVLDEAGRGTLTEIAKIADMPVSTIQRAVQTLEADELVRREGHRGPIVFRPAAPRAALREVADWSLGPRRAATIANAARTLAQRPPSVPSTIRDPAIRAAWPATIDAIVREFGPKRVILFGSQARGDAVRDSDVDLLVVFEDVADRRERAIEIASLLRSAPFPKDILVASERDAARPMAGTAMADALREGLVVYGR